MDTSHRQDEPTGPGPLRVLPTLDAVVVVASDLDLASVLDRIVSAARLLVGARYGALGVGVGGGPEPAGGRS